MRELAPAIAAVTCYVGLLFLLAVWVERRVAAGRNVTDNALVYTLAQAVYCTTWTYYGSVGYGVSSGLLFLTVYLGPTVAFCFSGSVLRRLVRIKASHKITSIADFISARYGKSQAVGALVTVMALVGLVPYLSLQLKMMILTTGLMSGLGRHSYPGIGSVIGPVMVGLMVLFTIVFGIRRLRPTERHPGMMAALVAECVVKLVAFLVAGAFVVYGLFNGFGDLLGRASSLPVAQSSGGRGITPPAVTWLSHMLLSAAAIFFLPRQFHVAVVENSSERHLRTARWLLPLYLLGISIFALPISIAGVAAGLPPGHADTFVLDLPMAAGHRWLSWLVYLGGFSAGTGMVMIETMTIATMVSNHLLLPVVAVWQPLAFLRRRIRPFRWVSAAVIIAAALAYERLFGWRYEIVRTGLISFAAALQLAPAALGGLYWKQASRRGALLGLCAGFALWAYTLIVPVLAREGILPVGLLDSGPFGLTALRPEALFGVACPDPLTHTALWSMAFNVGLFVVGSLIWPPSVKEARDAELMVEAVPADGSSGAVARRPALIDSAQKRQQIGALLEAYFGEAASRQMMDSAFEAAGLSATPKLTILHLAELEAEVERTLAASIGVAAAHVAIRRAGIIGPEEAGELSRAYAEMLAELKVSPSELRRKVEQERAARESAEKAEHRSALLAEASGLLAESPDPEVILPRLARLLVPAAGQWCLIHLLRDGEPRRIAAAHADAAREALLVDCDVRYPPRWGSDHPVARAMATGKPLLLPPPSPEVLRARCEDEEHLALVRALGDPALAAPMILRGRVLGAISLGSAPPDPRPDRADLEVAVELARRAALALDNAQKNEFLSVASHELNTPMAALSLCLESLADAASSRDPKWLDKHVRMATRQADRLARLIRELLDVTRIERGKLSLEPHEVDLRAVVREAIARYRPELERARCEVKVLADTPVFGTWDTSRIDQVMLNLLSNGAKFGAGKPIEVRVERAGDVARVSVTDHGIGIAPAEQARVFERFERGYSASSYSGLGLGLYISRRIVEAHHGAIRVESEPGHGATFVVELPCSTGAPAEMAAQPA